MWLLTALGSEWSNWAPRLMERSGVPSSVASAGLLFLNANELVVPLLLTVLQRSTVMERARWALVGTSGLALVALLVLVAVAAAGAGPTVFVGLSVVASYFGIAVWVFHYSLTPSYFAAEVRGTGFGICMTFNRLGYITGPLIAASLIQSNNVTLLIACAACYLGLVGLATALRLLREDPSREGEMARLAETH
mmetsp:Transcript_70361/g.209760  ORF Transcript_70361/g.209760 Transcript_70361/m.209760 type:complete len:193 (+) Transcript_70361:2-580(+)